MSSRSWPVILRAPMVDEWSGAARVLMILTFAVAAACIPAAVNAGDREPWTIWMSPQGAGMWPLGDYLPPGPKPAWGVAGHIVLQPSRSPFGLRFAAGFTRNHVEPDSVQVYWGYGVSAILSSLKAGNDLRWVTGGVQWDPRPQRTSIYAYAAFGVMSVKPVGEARVPDRTFGCIDCRYQMPGLPAGSAVPMFATGLGSRVQAGNKSLGISGEVEYLHTGAVDQVGPAGVEGSYPDTHYSSRHGAIGAISAKLGFSLRR